MSKVIIPIKQKIGDIQVIHYYSDGAHSQCKNYKSFVNLCYHKIDHGIDAEWHFFATSHGKSVCDGIGGTAKSLATNASLKATERNHILTPIDLFNWAEKNINNISFLFVSADEIKNTSFKNKLDKLYALVKSEKKPWNSFSSLLQANFKQCFRNEMSFNTFNLYCD